MARLGQMDLSVFAPNMHEVYDLQNLSMFNIWIGFKSILLVIYLQINL